MPTRARSTPLVDPKDGRRRAAGQEETREDENDCDNNQPRNDLDPEDLSPARLAVLGVRSQRTQAPVTPRH